jgi:hypothetical protein
LICLPVSTSKSRPSKSSARRAGKAALRAAKQEHRQCVIKSTHDEGRKRWQLQE